MGMLGHHKIMFGGELLIRDLDSRCAIDQSACETFAIAVLALFRSLICARAAIHAGPPSLTVHIKQYGIYDEGLRHFVKECGY